MLGVWCLLFATLSRLRRRRKLNTWFPNAWVISTTSIADKDDDDNHMLLFVFELRVAQTFVTASTDGFRSHCVSSSLSKTARFRVQYIVVVVVIVVVAED